MLLAFKIPLLVSAMWGLHTSITAPQPPPRKEDRERAKPKNFLEWFLTMRSHIKVVKVCGLVVVSSSVHSLTNLIGTLLVRGPRGGSLHPPHPEREHLLPPVPE